MPSNNSSARGSPEKALCNVADMDESSDSDSEAGIQGNERAECDYGLTDIKRKRTWNDLKDCLPRNHFEGINNNRLSPNNKDGSWKLGESCPSTEENTLATITHQELDGNIVDSGGLSYHHKEANVSYASLDSDLSEMFLLCITEQSSPNEWTDKLCKTSRISFWKTCSWPPSKAVSIRSIWTIFGSTVCTGIPKLDLLFLRSQFESCGHSFSRRGQYIRLACLYLSTASCFGE